jgi:DNA invertase Pin-like site-specific DNA recombinase
LARYVAYYRVRSGGTLDRNGAVSLQRAAVERFLAAGDELVREFIEDEGPQHRRRRHFAPAVTSAKRHHAILVIPRFRPIHRNATFVECLRDADVDFLALDMLEANRDTIGPIAAAAAKHRQLVSERIRASLQSAKARGRVLGNPEIALARLRAAQAARAKALEQREAQRGEVVNLRKGGRSLRAIADDLNRRDIPTARGRQWHASSVRKILAEAGDPLA